MLVDKKLNKLAKEIARAGQIIARDEIEKEYNLGYSLADTIIVKSDSGYEAIYIGDISKGSTSGYMCLYTNNTEKRNSYPKTDKITELLKNVVAKKKLPTGEGKAAYFDWDEFGGMKKQMDYFSRVICKMAGISRYVCQVCRNEEINLGQNFCQICGEPIAWKEIPKKGMKNRLKIEWAKVERDSETGKVEEYFKKYLYLDIAIYSDTEKEAVDMLSDFEFELNKLLRENTGYKEGSLMRCTRYGESEDNQLWDSMGFDRALNGFVTEQKQDIIEFARQARKIVLKRY